jgi:hypothetical protein
MSVNIPDNLSCCPAEGREDRLTPPSEFSAREPDMLWWSSHIVVLTGVLDMASPFLKCELALRSSMAVRMCAPSIEICVKVVRGWM